MRNVMYLFCSVEYTTTTTDYDPGHRVRATLPNEFCIIMKRHTQRIAHAIHQDILFLLQMLLSVDFFSSYSHICLTIIYFAMKWLQTFLF